MVLLDHADSDCFEDFHAIRGAAEASHPVGALETAAENSTIHGADETRRRDQSRGAELGDSQGAGTAASCQAQARGVDPIAPSSPRSIHGS